MKDIISLDQFRKPSLEKSQADVSLPKNSESTGTKMQSVTITGQKDKSTPSEVKLTKAARDFRVRFLSALATLKTQANRELELASKKSDIKTRINVSSVLKLAKSSPLTVYSPLHRETLIPMVEAAAIELDAALTDKFATGVIKRKQTIASLEQDLKEAKTAFEAQLSRIASQKLTDHVDQRDSR